MPIALPALAVVDVVMIAVVGLVLALAAYSIYRPVVVDVLSQIPVIGGAVVRVADSLLARAVSSAQGWAQNAQAPAAHLMGRWWASRYFLGWHALQTGQMFFNWVSWIRRALIPLVQFQLEALTRLAFTQSLMFARLLFTQALAYAAALAAAQEALTRLAFTQSLMFAATLAQQAEALTRLAFTQALAFADARALQAEAYARDLVLGAQAYTRQVQDWARGAILDALTGAERYADARALEAERYAQVLQRQSLDYTAASVAAALAAMAALVRPLAEDLARVEDSPCMKVCNPLGDLGSLLQEIEDVGLAALVFGLVAEGIRDPTGTARAVNGALGPLLKDTGQALRDQLGIKPAA